MSTGVVPFLDLGRQHQRLHAELTEAAARVLASGQYSSGPEVAAFEREYAAHCGAAHAVAVSSGSAALELALQALGIGPGDEVITVPATFIATVAAILQVGARPVLVDIDPHRWTLDPDQARRAITGRTKALLPVHLYGHVADLDALANLAREHNLWLIEDAAQAHGASYRGQPVGSIGDCCCFSFYPTKNLGACGEGGLVTTRDGKVAERVKQLRSWGMDAAGIQKLPGHNYRLAEIQAAFLRVKLSYLDEWVRTRRALAATYSRSFAALPLQLPREGADQLPGFHLYSIRSERRDALKYYLSQEGVETRIHYPRPVHLQPTFASLSYPRGSFPEAEALAAEQLSLPLYPTGCE